ncbi:MAG: gliding motility protein [Pseudomonadota bacterium]|nr:gliding motility protein [Pseudomonadota bacterium]
MSDRPSSLVGLHAAALDPLEPADLVATVRSAAPAVEPAVAAELGAVLASIQPDSPLSARLDTLVALATWLRDATPLVLPDRASVGDRSGAARLWLLVEVLHAEQASRAALSRLVTSVLVETSAARLFTNTGLPSELRFFAEFADRLARHGLPRPPEHTCLAALVTRIFPDERATLWLDAAPPQLVVELASLLTPFGTAFAPGESSARREVEGEAADALALLAVRAAALGLDRDFRSRSEVAALGAEPVLALARTSAAFLDARRRADTGDRAGQVEARRLRAEAVWHVASARVVLDGVVARLDEGGVSVDLVFRVELLGRLLVRADRLLALLDTDPPEPALQRARNVRFIRELVGQAIGDRSLLALVQQNSRLLARRIIERAGETGERYIAASRADWHGMLQSAAGGGYLTAGTTVAKFWVGWAHLPYFFEATFLGMNYAASFIAMQFLGFTLATKQPSMTAASIAASIDNTGHDGLEPLVDLISRTLRSQLAALIGNIGMVVPVVLAIDFIHVRWTGAAFLDADTAAYVISSHHPWTSGTVFFATLTGVLLWASSIFGGWLENWSALHRLPEAIAQSPFLGRHVGRPGAESLAHGFVRYISGIGTSLSLGLLLGAAPIVGKFFGLPVDVRHVTLSTGAMTFAGASVGPLAIAGPAFREALVGIVLIGMLNFTVSFTLALAVALRARNVPLVTLAVLLRAVTVRFLRRPMSFVYPPKDAPTPSAPPLART